MVEHVYVIVLRCCVLPIINFPTVTFLIFCMQSAEPFSLLVMPKVKKSASTSRLNHSYMEPVSQKAKVKKIKSKESRETHNLFENIAKDLIIANFGECKNDLEIFCRGLVNKVFSELRQEIGSIESANAVRISNIESKVNAATTKIDTVVAEQNTKIAKLQEELSRYQTESKEAMEVERGKRQSLTKKMQAGDEKSAEDFKKLFLVNKEEQNATTAQLSTEIANQAKDISKIKDSIEEM